MAVAGYQFRLIEIGRAKYSGEVTVKNSAALLHAVTRHLLSADIDIMLDGQVIVGGIRPVGHIEPMDDIARAVWRRWFV